MSEYIDLDLSLDESFRYARQIVMPGVGEVGQRKLKAASLLIVGLGGLGSPAALYLASAGIGRLTLLDSEVLDPSNLQRQVLYEERDIGRAKVEGAAKRLRAINSFTRIEPIRARLSEENAEKLIGDCDLVLSCVDNRSTRAIINRVCRQLGKAWVDGTVSRHQGTVMTYLPDQGPCYACLHDDNDPADDRRTPADLGVWGPAAGCIGALQAMEAIKYLLGERDNLLNRRMLWCDLLNMQMKSIDMQQRDDCPVCGQATP